MNTLKNHYPVILATVLFLAIVINIISGDIRQNEGNFIYAGDDCYIHMSMARNFSQYGVWGITKYEFSSSSSSLFWTLLISAVYFLFGVNDIWPLLLNLIISLFMIFLLYFILRIYKVNSFFIFFILLAIIFLTPLFTLVLLGLEHIVHTVITISIIYLASVLLSDEYVLSGKTISFREVLLLILSVLVTMTRYEGIFLIFVISLLYMFRKRISHALLIALAGFLPVGIYGLISLTKGWYFLPNSVLLKGYGYSPFTSYADLIIFAWVKYRRLVENPHMLMLIIGSLFLFYILYSKDKKLWKDKNIMLIIFTGLALLHMFFASTGWVYRYEAYLVAAGIFFISAGLSEYVHFTRDKTMLPGYVTAIILCLLMLLPLVERSYEAFNINIKASSDIYREQYQMGLFLKKFYNGETVALNDIGATSYLSEIKILDIWGLGSLEIAKANIGKYYTSDEIYRLAEEKQVNIAICYELPEIPSGWIKVGQLEVPDATVSGKAVSFYGINSSEADRLARNLKHFKFPRGTAMFITRKVQ